MAATSNAFNNTNQNQFGNLNFTDWGQVADMFGTSVVSALQQNNVPLDQVGSTIGKLGIAQQVQGGQGGQFGAGNPQFISSGFTLADAINQQQGGGSGMQQQSSNWDPTKNPNYDTASIGAKALDVIGLNPSHSVTVNPSPSQTPTSSDFQKSGVSAVANPEQVALPSSFNPQTQLGSVFTAMTPDRPSAKNYSVSPTAQPTGANFQSGQAFASPPPISTPRAPGSSSAGTLPPPPAAPAGAIQGSPFNTSGPISGLSPSATPPGPANMPGVEAAFKHMATGGQVGTGDTDTVPAMLTPGEYVINRDAAQRIGVGRLNRLNAERPLHMADGGYVSGLGGYTPSTSPSAMYGMGQTGDPNAQSPDAQSYAFNQLSPSEQVALQGGGTGAIRVQQKYNQLVNSYQGSSGTPTPMSAQMGGMQKPAAMTTAQVHPQAPAAPAGQPQQQQQTAGYNGSLDQWLAQYGHTPQGQAYIAQNGNVSEVQRYLQNLTTPQQTSPSSPAYGTAPRAGFVGAPAGYGAAPRAELVGLPAGQGEAYDPKTYGINAGAGTPNVAGGIASGIGAIGSAIAQAFTKGASQPYKWIQSAIPNPEDFKRQTPDIVLQGHQVGRPNAQGGYVMMAQPYDQSQAGEVQPGQGNTAFG